MGQNHQYESITYRRHGGTRDFSLCEKIKAKEESQFNHTGVRDKVKDILKKKKREHPVTRSTS